MANEAIERAVDDLITKGRVSRDMRNEYIQHFESNLQNEILRGSDYTNKTKALAEEKRQAQAWLDQERAKFQNERRQLEQWQNQVKGQLEDADRVARELPGMAAKLAAYEQTLSDFQILDKVHVPTTQPSIPSITDRRDPTPQRGSFPAFNPADAPFLTKEAGAGALKDLTVLMGKMNKIQAQHMRLFGEILEDDLVAHYMETGEDPERHWAVKYNVEGKKAEIANKNREAEIAAIREQIRSELMQTMALDPSRVTGLPGQAHKGGLTPLMEQYAQSRALAHGHDTSSQAAPPKADDFVPPEKKSDIAMSRDRVSRAADMFAKNFDLTGRPTSDEGRRLYQKHLVTE